MKNTTSVQTETLDMEPLSFDICPMTGLPIQHRPEWTDVAVAENYSVSFSVIGNAILRTAPNGIISDAGTRKIIKEREKVLRSANLLDNQYAEIRDYSRLLGRVSKESRLLMTDLVLNETNAGNLLGFWVFNAPLAVRWMFNVGTKLHKLAAPAAAVKDYKNAIENAVKVLEKRGINAGTRCYLKSTKDDWSLELDDYGIRFELIGNDILFTTAYGILKEAYVEKFFNLQQKVLDESGITAKGYYYRILNWENFEKSIGKARRMYLDRLNALNRAIPCKYSAVFGLNTFAKAIIGISRPFVNFPIAAAKNLEDALAIIEKEKNKKAETPVSKKKKKLPPKLFTAEQIKDYSDELMQFMGSINWDQHGILSDHIGDSHPFRAVFDAVEIIKGDVDDFLRERRQAEETLRVSEEKYRTILESIEQGYYEADLAGSFTFFNDSMCKLFGYSRNELMGMNNRQYMDQENAARAYKTFNKVYRTGEPEKGLVCDFTRKDGVKRRIGFSIALMKDAKGRRIGFRGIASDVTERRILQEQLAQSQKLESIGQLAAGIAHEINTPTQFLSDNTHFLRDAFGDIFQVLGQYDELLKAIKAGKVPANLVEETESVIKNVDIDYLMQEIPLAIRQSLEGLDRTAGIVRAMKEFSHPGMKSKAPVDINAAIQSTITVARNEWKYVATMETDFDSTLTAVPCLAGELNQVILNLIINAAAAIAEVVGDDSEKQGTIRISTRRDGHGAEIRVSDTGTGIPESIRTRIFDPFFTTKKVGKGSGQGLAISHAVIVKKHGGTIRFETEMGKGTTFIIRLPLDDAPEINEELQGNEMGLLLRTV